MASKTKTINTGPLKMAKWDWQGKARRYTANQPPQWGLIGGSSWPTIVPKAAIGINVYSPPEWTNNVRKVPYQHNTFGLPSRDKNVLTNPEWHRVSGNDERRPWRRDIYER